MDDRLTAQIREWLDAAPEARDTAAGADLLLRLDRNRTLHANILRRPARMAGKLEYELRKHLRIRLDGLTLHGLAVMERGTLAAADETLAQPAPGAPQFRGRRADHDRLPEAVRAVYERNGEVWRKLRQVRETLRTMEDAAPCDRYELCKVLGELDREYRRNWETYDHFRAEDSGTEAAPAPAPPTAAEVSAARKYLSKAHALLAGGGVEGGARAALVGKMQARVAVIEAAGGGFTPQYRESLERMGLRFGTSPKNGKEHE